jgi:beta-glucosidase/6-phospho-beta-glucosidase/beta-galactosidase
LRYGPPYSQAHVAKYTYEFTLTDKVVEKCKELGITLMVDLLHFGLPEWLHQHRPDEPFFQNPDFPMEFAAYANVFAKRYPHIRYYTLINEPFITANFSTKLGIWNENRRGEWDEDDHFVKAIANIAKAAIMAKEEIYHVWKEERREKRPVFVQNESFEVAIASRASHREREADRFNVRRFAGLDLIFGHWDEIMRWYLLSHGMTDSEYKWFMEKGNDRDTVLGIDHYPTCVHKYGKRATVDATPDEPYRLYELVKVYWQRYKLPMLHTETNGWPMHAVQICQKTYNVLNHLRQEGYPVLGMGWYGDEYQVGWHYAMFGPLSFEESPVGLYYKGELQPVGKLFEEYAKKGLQPLHL